jgi:hypothetical protein
LSALSSVERSDASSLEKIVFVTVVGIAEKAFGFLTTRAGNKFPQAQIFKLELSRSSAGISDTPQSNDKPQVFVRLTDLMGAVKPRPEGTEPHSVRPSAEDREFKPAFSGGH